MHASPTSPAPSRSDDASTRNDTEAEPHGTAAAGAPPPAAAVVGTASRMARRTEGRTLRTPPSVRAPLIRAMVRPAPSGWANLPSVQPAQLVAVALGAAHVRLDAHVEVAGGDRVLLDGRRHAERHAQRRHDLVVAHEGPAAHD